MYACPPQVLSVWQWWSYCRAQVPAHKRILNINLDESSVPVWLGGAAGTVVVRDSTGQRIPENRASASLSLKRGAVTLVAWICDNTTIQPFLPQIVLVNRALMSEEEWQVLFGMLPPNVLVIRRKSGWNTKHEFRQMLKVLVAALRPVLAQDEWQLILLLDCVSLHYAASVLEECAKLSVWVVFIPASMTWLVQPLDTHGFLKLKQCLRKMVADTRATLQGELTCADMILHLAAALRRVFQGTQWAGAFAANGFSPDRRRVSTYICRQLAWPVVPEVPASKPTDAQMRAIFPKKSKPSLPLLWHPFVAPAKRLLGAGCPPKAKRKALAHDTTGVDLTLAYLRPRLWGRVPARHALTGPPPKTAAAPAVPPKAPAEPCAKAPALAPPVKALPATMPPWAVLPPPALFPPPVTRSQTAAMRRGALPRAEPLPKSGSPWW